jgi:hypothetical protein
MMQMVVAKFGVLIWNLLGEQIRFELWAFRTQSRTARHSTVAFSVHILQCSFLSTFQFLINHSQLVQLFYCHIFH